MAIRLKQAGIDDFVLLERAGDVGGTWRDNTYPGCQCDVPSHLYSFSFAPNPSWSRTFSHQREIWDYLRDCCRALRDHPARAPRPRGPRRRAGTTRRAAGAWRRAGGELTADVLVSGTGALSEPSIPDLPGLADFQGATFHSAQWDHDYDLEGKRVAVIGTGASAIQFVPSIQPEVAKLHLFQRTPPWVLPHNDRPITAGERRAYRRLPLPPAAHARSDLLGARDLRLRLHDPAHRQASRADRPRPPAPPGPRPRAPAQAHARTTRSAASAP